MSVDLYVACRECACAEHSQLNARHEVAESLCGLGWNPEFASKAREWLEASPDFGLASPQAEILLGFAEVHEGHTLGIVGADDLYRWPWRQERAAIPALPALEAALGGQTGLEEAARLARYRSDPALLEPLLKLAGSEVDPEARRQAGLSLASLANSQGLSGEALAPILSALGAALRDSEPAARSAAAEALSLLISGHPEVEMYDVLYERSEALADEVAALLEEALEAPEAPSVTLIQALGRCARPRSLGAIVTQLRSSDPAAQRAATYALRPVAGAGAISPQLAAELIELARAALPQGAEPSLQQSWGQVLLACGAPGVEALKHLYRTRGVCYLATQGALCGHSARRDSLSGPPGRALRRRASLAPDHQLDLPSPTEAAPALPPPSLAEPRAWTEFEGEVSVLAASRELLIAASGQGDLVAFELGSLTAQPRERWRARPFPHGVRTLALSPSGTWLVCAGWGGEVEVFDAASGEPLQPLERSWTWFRALGFLGEDALWGVLDPSWAGFWNPNPIVIWDLASGEQILATTGSCAAAAGDHFVVGASEARLNAPFFSQEPLGLQGAARQNRIPAPLARFSGPDLSWSGLLELPREAEPREPAPQESRGGQRALAFAPSGQTLAIARSELGGSDLVLLELGGEAAPRIVPTAPAELLAWRPDGRALAWTSSGDTWVLDLATPDADPLRVEASAPLCCTALCWAGPRLVLGTEAGRIWSVD